MLLFKLLIYLAVALLTAFDIEEEVDRRNFGAQACVGLFQLLFQVSQAVFPSLIGLQERG
jgi:hypothetical protein